MMQSALVLFVVTLFFPFLIQIYAQDYPAAIKKTQPWPIACGWPRILYIQSFSTCGTAENESRYKSSRLNPSIG
jgi:hypothetical protein